jgi:hypothetical protein
VLCKNNNNYIKISKEKLQNKGEKEEGKMEKKRKSSFAISIS